MRPLRKSSLGEQCEVRVRSQVCLSLWDSHFAALLWSQL